MVALGAVDRVHTRDRLELLRVEYDHLGLGLPK